MHFVSENLYASINNSVIKNITQNVKWFKYFMKIYKSEIILNEWMEKKIIILTCDLKKDCNSIEIDINGFFRGEKGRNITSFFKMTL